MLVNTSFDTLEKLDDSPMGRQIWKYCKHLVSFKVFQALPIPVIYIYII